MFRYDSTTKTFVPIPFQIDERVDHTFNVGLPLQFTETIYDVMDEDDGLLDANDELVFLYGDTGPRATQKTVWPLGSEAYGSKSPSTIRARVPHSPEVGVPVLGEELERSATTYITWATGRTAPISTPGFSLDYDDRWLLTTLKIFPPAATVRI